MRLPPIYAIACAVLAAPATAGADVDKKVQMELETVYSAWRQALTQQDSVRWLAQTARYRQGILRNQVISQDLPWPRAIFSLIIQPPDTSRLKVLETKTVQDVARVVYYGKIDFAIPGEAAPDNALLLWFLREGGQWKFNTVQYVNLNDPQLKVQVSNGDTSFLQEEEFATDGKYPEMPKPCEAPYHVARMEVIAQGAKVAVTVNGTMEEVVKQTAASRVVIGGLRKGPNRVVIKPEMPAKDPAKIRLEVRLLISSGNPAKPESELFSWKLDPAKPAAVQEFTVWAPSKVRR